MLKSILYGLYPYTVDIVSKVNRISKHWNKIGFNLLKSQLGPKSISIFLHGLVLNRVWLLWISRSNVLANNVPKSRGHRFLFLEIIFSTKSYPKHSERFLCLLSKRCTNRTEIILNTILGRKRQNSYCFYQTAIV